MLIVEDSRIIRDRIKQLFSEVDNVAIVGEAETADSAIKLGTRLKPDVLILDIKLSGSETGFTVLRKMKKIHPNIITIMLSNHSSTHYKRKLAELGVDFFFDKSKEFEKMVKVFSWI